ncbi:hypothetical protein RBB50_004946 [Rhinocladiella similis]
MAKPQVIVIGGGPVGLFVSLRLTQLGVRVLILEKETTPQPLPRALGYFGAAMLALEKAGIWEDVKARGPTFGALGWRKGAVAQADGSKAWGDEVAYWNLADGSPYKEGEPGWGMVIMGQHLFREIILPKLETSGLAEIRRGYGLTSLSQDEHNVMVVATNEAGEEEIFTANYAIGADGGKSATRKQLGLELEGFTWPEVIISSDVELNVDTPGRTGVNYIIEPINWCFFCPLSYPNPNGPTPYRVTFPMSEAECEPAVYEENIKKKFEIIVPGPRPLKYEVLRQQPYRIHQRLASTMNVGRVCLAGDAAHLNSPWGALGLTTGLLDAESLADALDYVINHGKALSVLQTWSDSRRKAFATVTNPISTKNKLRCSDQNPDTAAKDDAFLKAIVDRDEEKLAEIAHSFDNWRTDMTQLVS